MKEILFVTTNKGKVESLQHSFDLLNADVVVTQTGLELAEEQAEDALKVAQAKAKLAFRELAKPLVVDNNTQDSSVYFMSNLVYVDKEGKQYCFSGSSYNDMVAHTYKPDTYDEVAYWYTHQQTQ